MENTNQRKSKGRLSGSIKFFCSDLEDLEKNEKIKVSKLKYASSAASRSSDRSNSVNKLSRTTSTPSSAGNAHLIKDWIDQKSISHIRDRHSIENLPIRQLCSRVLRNEETFVKGVEEFLKEQELLNLRKKELLHKKWQEKVYFPLRKEVEKSIETGYDAIDEVRRKEYINYLTYHNKKGDVFLDVISKNEYDPLIVYGPSSPVAIRAKFPKLRDPLRTFDRQRFDEEKLILQCETGLVYPNSVIVSRRLPQQPLVPLGREDPEGLTSWLALSLRNLDGPYRYRSRQRMGGKSNKTDIDFATWSNTTFEPEVADREMRIQKKRRFKIPSTMPQPSVLSMTEKANVRFANPPVTSKV